MAGDSLSDLQFGWNAGMKTALIATNPEEIKKMDEHLQANAIASPPVFPSLLAMVQTITAPV
jgi:histidinol phosphatase-like enzyme